MNANNQNNEDIVDAAAKKDLILDRINKRNKDRLNYLDSKNEQKHKYGLQIEGADYFSETFNERVHEIDLRIQNVSDAAAKKIVGENNINPDLKRIFADITIEIQELERYLTKSTMFLTDYKIKTCQTILSNLSHANEEARMKLLPKKKFGFSGRKNKVSTTNTNEKTSAETGADIKNEKSDASNLKETEQKLNKTMTETANTNENTNAAAPPTNPNANTTTNKAKNMISQIIDNGATIQNKKNQYICLAGLEVDRKDITLSCLDNCFVELRGHLGSLQLNNVNNCVLLSGPVARACFVQYCENTSIAVACQQLRLHNSHSIALYLHVTCRAVIEESRQIKVAPYNYEYNGVYTDFIGACLDRTINKYYDVADFDWLSPNIPSPNWSLVTENDQTPTTTWEELRTKFKERIDLRSSK